jgi:hypothetical protein
MGHFDSTITGPFSPTAVSFGAAMAPAAESGVVETLLAGKGCGGQTAPIKRRQMLRAPVGLGAPQSAP